MCTPHFQSSRTGASSVEGLMSYRGHMLWSVTPSAEIQSSEREREREREREGGKHWDRYENA